MMPDNLVPATNTVQIYPNDLINFCFRDFEVHLITFDPQNRMIICVCVFVRYVVVLSDRERDPQQRLGSVTPQLCKRLTSKLPSSWMLVVVYQPFRYHGVWGDCHIADPC